MPAAPVNQCGECGAIKYSTGRGEPCIRGPGDVYARCEAAYLNEKQEVMRVLLLDVRHRVIEEFEAHRGTLTEVTVHPRDVFRQAIAHSAAAVIVLHNHPSGNPAPSAMDIELTSRLRAAGELVGIPLLDHVVVATQGYYSLAEKRE